MTLFMDDVYRLHIKQLTEIALIWCNDGVLSADFNSGDPSYSRVEGHVVFSHKLRLD